VTTDFTLERLLETKLELIDELIELKKPNRSSCINGNELRGVDSKITHTWRNWPGTKQTKADGKSVCQFAGCDFTVANSFGMTARAKSMAIGTHHRQYHSAEIRDFVLEELTRGVDPLDLYKAMADKRWCSNSSARKWVREMTQEL
jgi:hypothetical protein